MASNRFNFSRPRAVAEVVSELMNVAHISATIEAIRGSAWQMKIFIKLLITREPFEARNQKFLLSTKDVQ